MIKRTITYILLVVLFFISLKVVGLGVSVVLPKEKRMRVEVGHVPELFPVLLVRGDRKDLSAVVVPYRKLHTEQDAWKDYGYLVPDKMDDGVDAILSKGDTGQRFWGPSKVQVSRLPDGRQRIRVTTKSHHIWERTITGWYVADSKGISPEYYRYENPGGRELGMVLPTSLPTTMVLWALGLWILHRIRNERVQHG